MDASDHGQTQDLNSTVVFIDKSESYRAYEAKMLADMLASGSYVDNIAAMCPECGDAVINLGQGNFACKCVLDGSCEFSLSFGWSDDMLMIDPVGSIAILADGNILEFRHVEDESEPSEFVSMLLIHDASSGWGLQVISGLGHNPAMAEGDYVHIGNIPYSEFSRENENGAN